jgi:hypothetical protein
MHELCGFCACGFPWGDTMKKYTSHQAPVHTVSRTQSGMSFGVCRWCKRAFVVERPNVLIPGPDRTHFVQ